MSETVIIARAEAEDLIAAALRAAGTSPANAASVAAALVAAQIDGQGGHGFSRVASYAAQTRSGKVQGDAVPTAELVAPALLRIDARHGFAFPAMDVLLRELPGLAAETGIAAAMVVNSHHCGQAGHHVERLAERGLVALLFANTPQAMAPWGGAKPVFGTNPIAFAAPRAAAPPLVIDLSLSKVARGKVMAAQKAGEPIPEGWAIDVEGQPTTDPEAALAGSMIPMGDAKGAALALMVEILAAALTGAAFSYEASSFFEAEGAPPSVGQLVIGFDVARLGSGVEARLSALCETMLSAGKSVRLPGDGRFARREKAEAEGIAVPAHLLAEIKALAEA